MMTMMTMITMIFIFVSYFFIIKNTIQNISNMAIQKYLKRKKETMKSVSLRGVVPRYIKEQVDKIHKIISR